MLEAQKRREPSLAHGCVYLKSDKLNSAFFGHSAPLVHGEDGTTKAAQFKTKARCKLFHRECSVAEERERVNMAIWVMVDVAPIPSCYN
jgi:hypothetical protein